MCVSCQIMCHESGFNITESVKCVSKPLQVDANDEETRSRSYLQEVVAQHLSLFSPVI